MARVKASERVAEGTAEFLYCSGEDGWSTGTGEAASGRTKLPLRTAWLDIACGGLAVDAVWTGPNGPEQPRTVPRSSQNPRTRRAHATFAPPVPTQNSVAAS